MGSRCKSPPSALSWWLRPALLPQPLPPASALTLSPPLSFSQVSRIVKPQILSSFGDLAMAVGELFAPYIEVTLSMLTSAAAVSHQAAASNDEDMIEYNNQLRNGIFEAFSGEERWLRWLPCPALPPLSCSHLCSPWSLD